MPTEQPLRNDFLKIPLENLIYGGGVDIKCNGPVFWISLVFGGDCCTDTSVVKLFSTALLRSQGHTVEFTKTPDRDDVELVVHGEIIYRCKIQDLQYGKLTQKQ